MDLFLLLTFISLHVLQTVGDLAQVMVSNKLSKDEVQKNAASLNLPTSVIQYLQVSFD